MITDNFFQGGGRDLATAASFAKKPSTTVSNITNSTSTATKASSSYPIKVEIPAFNTSTKMPLTNAFSGGLGKMNMLDGNQMRFIPPKVNTANNRVPASNTGFGMSGGSAGEFLFVVFVLG